MNLLEDLRAKAQTNNSTTFLHLLEQGKELEES